MRICVVVVSWNGERDLPRCLDSLRRWAPDVPVVVVDNASEDASREISRTRGAVLITNSENRGFTAAANQGMVAALAEPSTAEAVFLLNQDAWLDGPALTALAAGFAAHPEAGILGCRILYPAEDALQHAGGILDPVRMAGRHRGLRASTRNPKYLHPCEVDFVTGAAMAIRDVVLSSCGLFDELFSPGYLEDVDLCLRARAAGFSVVYWPDACIKHYESASFTQRQRRLHLSHRNRLLCLLLHASTAEAVSRFATAELESILSTSSVDDLRALASASFELFLDVPDLVRNHTRFKGHSPQLIHSFTEALVAVRHATEGRLIAVLKTPG